MGHVGVQGQTVAVEGALLGRACEEFQRVLAPLREAVGATATVDLSRGTAIAPESMSSVFELWLAPRRRGGDC